jgi:predicted transporter
MMHLKSPYEKMVLISAYALFVVCLVSCIVIGIHVYTAKKHFDSIQITKESP